MTEEHLRELLRQAVPAAPVIDPVRVRRRALAARRSKLWVAMASAAAVLLVAGGPVALSALRGDDPAQSVAPGPAASGPSPRTTAEPRMSPYDAPACPPLLPEGGAAVQALRDLSDIVAVRACPDFNPRGGPGGQPSAEMLAELEDADALVHRVEDFLDALRKMPTGLPDYCARDDGPYVRLGLSFSRADGTRTLLTARGCELVTIEGLHLDIGAVQQRVLDALKAQREALTYSRPFDDALTCTTSTRGGPVRPGRERLVLAVACDLPDGAESIPDDLPPIPLDATQLAGLNRAWSRPGEALSRGPNGEHECLDVAEPPSFVIAATDRSDVVQLIDTPCGYMVWHGSPDHDSLGATVPTTLGALGVD
jgi:hypothetical protein